MVLIGSHRKQLAEQNQFRAPRSTRHRPIRSVEQLRDEVVPYVAVVGGMVDSMVDLVVEEVIDPVVVVEEVGLKEVARVVHPYVNVADSVPSVTTDTEVTTPSTEPSVHTDGGFPGGLIDQSVLIEYADHVALRVWQRKTYVFYV